ncbi:MAG TPA: S8 family peptidase [Sphingomicrobium sp.]|nr:S8 family peptidase [Sphingomicrobium sp.]
MKTLVQPITLATGGGEKAHPYEFDEAYAQLRPELEALATAINDLPDLACPNDEAVASITLHPAYLAKSYHPTRLLGELGLRQVGSRERRLFPRKWTKKEPPSAPLIAPELFVAGNRQRLASLGETVRASRDGRLFDEFRRIEHIAALGTDRLRLIPGDDPRPPLEVILHADVSEGWGEDVLRAFRKWCAELGIDVDWSRRQHVGGLSFLGFHAARTVLDDLVQFAFLRTARRMPKLVFRDAEFRSFHTESSFAVRLPSDDVVDSELRAAIFDGGLPSNHPFPGYVVPRDAPGIGAAARAALRHGTEVTSAFLYGPLNEGEQPDRPFAGVDHWRVVDANGDDFELLTTLDRIMDVLEQHPYEVVSISLGPDEAMLDDDVHVWTSRLDQFAATGHTLVISAAGNNGEMDEPSGLCRVQPASDGVNVLAVGSADRQGDEWSRAPYSAKGPGRSPGLVKPDIVAFGGSDGEPFFAVDQTGTARGVCGTSFAAPAAARLGLGLKALFGGQLTSVAVKALLVHQAEDRGQPQCEVGWGCLPSTLDELATCAPGEATIVYQGLLEPARHRRFFIPVPADGFDGTVSLKATFVAATAVDPEDAINYTRTGVGITFRPKTVGHTGWYNQNGEMRERSAHESRSFFGQSALFQTEQQLRDDAQRWEAVLKARKGFRPATLDQPVFDIEHLARSHGQPAQRSDSVHYALIVTISERGADDLYNRIIRSYAGRLEALIPQVEIPIRARGA